MKQVQINKFVEEHGEEILCGLLGVTGMIIGAGVMKHYYKKECALTLFKWLSLSESNGIVKFFDPSSGSQTDLAGYLGLLEKYNF